ADRRPPPGYTPVHGPPAALQHIQFNVVNADTLREAQQRPQDYAGLVVRVAGYSAFFVELSKEIQDDIIRRTAHQL
ncbi:glycine radical domain-containing protein, partial [Klebsiella pneumoniae]|uniref:glycine radical domain-containing protein n=1 Tax=Klebsiella pneumoniae TaxID=573 RepID=UPI003968B52F